LQEEEIRRVGGSSAKKINVRVISATSRNLEEDVSSGRFREDLFFRLNVFALTLPPLRERLDDLELLLEHFLAKFSIKFGKSVTSADPDALRALNSYAWPGNVREFENAIERGVLLSEKDILTVEGLPAKLTAAAPADQPFQLSREILSIKQAGEVMERELISRALESTGGNRTHAAKVLEISLRSLIYKIKEYGLE
jgi:two-component system response regulator AtoC